ncbi:hypothetical protein [Tumebacillus flagellatus]|uniref:B box-type domain-containing protein n=1 Tax=Tumebacillus flagellatus TaxID=1157490 RepID=A0A074LQZ1_9BACL|nr:hypothetical protein [Tumebacillus flagellatus]KEO84541.1 hypothetical protein EL26_03210 [Tumebacillus flagellatus]
MHCHYHPEHSVARECRVCHHLICTECIIEVGEDALCKSCVAEQLLKAQAVPERPQVRPELQAAGKAGASVPPHQQAVQAVRDKDQDLNRPIKSGFLTVLFSCLPGLGHYYLGMEKRGLNLMVLFFGLIFLVAIIPSVVTFPLGLGFPILWFYSQFDALKYRSLINLGATIEDKPVIPQMMRFVTYRHLGWLLAILAMMGIVSNLLNMVPMDYTVRGTIRELLSALVLLAIGFWILKGKDISFVPREESEERNHA